MSSILKALRKLEEEKAAHGEAAVDISRDILKRSARKQDRNNFWPSLSVVLFLLLIGSGAFFWSNRPASVVLPNKTTPITTSSTAPMTIISQPPLKEILPESAETTKTEKAPMLPGPAAEATPPKETVPAPQVKVEPEALRPNGVPFLKLTGIAYREKSVERIAIINDLPVMQGTAIEGAKLIEILPERVILSWQGVQFDLQLEDEK